MSDMFSTPKNMLFPDEASSCLKDQIAVFAQENALLKRDLVGLEDKYAQMQVHTEFLKNLRPDRDKPLLPQFAVSSQNVSSKIVELSKSYREKCSELEKYKTKCSKLQTQLENSKSREQLQKDPPKPAVEKTEDSTAKEKQQQKLSAMTSKMLELKNANMQLNNELKQARKLLQQEIGEDMETVRANGSWKGRAQIICDLLEKNKTLKQKLKISLDPKGARTDSHAIERISNRVSSLENENRDLKMQLQSYKSKSESLKSRCQMLESELQALKLRIQDVKERSSSDLDLIASMSSQLAEAEHVKRSAVKERELEIAKLRLETENLKAQVENYKTVMDGLKRNKDCREATTQNCQKNTAEIEQSVAKLEEQKLKLLELVKLHKKRIDEERNERQRCEQLLRIERQKSVRLESTVAKSELDCAATSRSRYSTQLNRNSEISLQDQLELAEENIKALQTRLQLEHGERRQDFQEFATILTTTNISRMPGQHN